MATVATVWNRFFDRAAAPTAERSRADEDARVPAFANDDIYFFVKRIDNSRVVRAADPVARGACWKLIGSVVAAAVLLVVVLLPSAYGLMAGYQIQSLRREGQRLAAEQASLELDVAQLLSPERMQELARIQQFIDPGTDQVVYLEGEQGSLASNQGTQTRP